MKGRKPNMENVVPMREEMPKPVPAPHDLMSDGAKAVWERLAPELVKFDRLKPHFEDVFAMYCESVADAIDLTSCIVMDGRTYSVKTRNGEQQKKTANWQARQDALANIRQFGALFGMTPVDEARLSSGAQGDLFDDLLRQLRGSD